ncbi:MAG: hypothetical protein LQ338_005987, partial [Usnochroma carphineum]
VLYSEENIAVDRNMDSMSMTAATATMAMSPTTGSMAGMATSTASASSGMSMSGMGMGMGGGSHACKISMLWNWYTIDACFISSTWQITSKGKFAGSCIGVICLVIVLECLRRLQREYDAFLVKQYRARSAQNLASIHKSPSETPLHPDVEANNAVKTDSSNILVNSTFENARAPGDQSFLKQRRLVPTVFQQAVRALIHMLQFAVAYFIMLLAMYYNGYIIISIIIGAFLGSFIFSWEGIQIADA